ncbi:hypothetical protein Tco_1420204 [Tanacetum coccineum]
MITRRAREVPDIVLIITPSYKLGFQRFNSPRIQKEKIYNYAKNVMVTVSHVIGDAVMKATYTSNLPHYSPKLDDMIELPKSQPKRTYNEDLECEIVMVKMPRCMAWLDDEPIGDLDTMEDKVDNPSPQCTP